MKGCCQAEDQQKQNFRQKQNYQQKQNFQQKQNLQQKQNQETSVCHNIIWRSVYGWPGYNISNIHCSIAE